MDQTSDTNARTKRSGTSGLEEPGKQQKMKSKPVVVREGYRGADRLLDRVALITGGDSGIGRSVAVLYAKEGADIAIVYKDEHEDAQETQRLIEAEGRQCLLMPGDIGSESFCQQAVQQTVSRLGRLDILINNAAEQHPRESIEDIGQEQLVRTFSTNIFSNFYLAKAALPHLRRQSGSTIINTASVVAYRGQEMLLDYSATKGAMVTFTRSLSKMLAPENIRVNAVAPGPIWTPLIPSTFPDEKVAKFGHDTPMGRPGQPWECAGAYVFLASEDATYITGQVLHINGGEVVNG